MLIPLSKLAVEGGILDGVNMGIVSEYLNMLRMRSLAPPVKVYDRNADGYYFLHDGYHRVLAALLEEDTYIHADVLEREAPYARLQWRRPRVLPITELAPRWLILREAEAQCGA